MALVDLIQTDRYTSSVIRDLLQHARQPGVISLAGGLPSSTLLPVERVKVGLSQVLERDGAAALQYGLTSGEPQLAELLASRAPHQTNPDQIVITAGSQQALDLLARALTAADTKDNIAAIEDPGYLGAIQALRSNGYTLAPIPVDENGMVVEELERQLVTGLRPRVCYVNPAFQNPTGASLSPARATRLVELAERYNFVVIADDPYAELYLDGVAPTPLPQSEMVAFLGSMSKTLSPGLRVGWLNANPALASAVSLAKQPADLQTSTVSQLLVAELLADQRWWDEHTKALRDEYRTRRQAMKVALNKRLPQATLSDQHGGFFLWVDLTPYLQSSSRQIDLMELLPAAVANGVAFVPGSAFRSSELTAADPGAPTVRLSYSSGDPNLFDEAIARLAACLTTELRTHDRPR